MIEQNYRIDMIPDGAPVVVHISQYDTTARRLSFELYNGGVAYELPAGAAASIAGTKPDNTSFLYAMTVSGNLVSIDLQQQMALVAGDVPAEIQITGAEGKIGSANFIIRVERGPIDENSVISETDLPIFEQLVSDAQTAADTASAAASSVASIVPASPGTAGQVLTKTATGADWADKYPNVLHEYVSRPASANDIPGNDRKLKWFLSSSSMTEGKPMEAGYIIQFSWDTSQNWASQLFIPSGSIGNKATPQFRMRDDNADEWSEWINIYSENHPQSSVTKSFTLSASSWSSGSYTISDALITATSNQEILPDVGITIDQLNALQKAMLVDGGQSAGNLTLKALGTAPTIDIPIRIIFRGVK